MEYTYKDLDGLPFELQVKLIEDKENRRYNIEEQKKKKEKNGENKSM